MKFYKEADGDWIINGEIIPAGTCRQKTESATGRITIKLIGAPLLESTLALKMLPTQFQDVNGNYYADLAAYELATSGFFVDAALAAAEQLEVDLGVEVQNRTNGDANLQNQINTVASGYLGAIAYNASAPTPAKNGWYDFSTGGVVSWLTGTPTVKIGDRVSVLYTAPSTYVYTYQNINLSGSIGNSLNSYSLTDRIKSDYAYYSSSSVLNSWQTDTAISYPTKLHNGNSQSGTQFIFGTLTSATGGANGNVWGISIQNGVNRIKDTITTILVSIWSDRNMPLITPYLYFSNGNGQIIEHNFNNLNIGWNYKYIKIKFLSDALSGESEYFLFGRDATGNRLNMAGATIFVCPPIISDNDITFLDYNISELYKKNAIINQTNLIPCEGDSLTYGAGSDKTTNKATVISKLKILGVNTSTLESGLPTYPLTMQAILGSQYNVINCGVGGENINTIAARIGAAPIICPKQFILPQIAGTTVEIADSATDTLKSSFDGTSIVAPLLQGSGNSVNPCYIDGIECTLSVIIGTPNRYKLTRTTTGGRDVTIPAGTSLILQGAKVHRNPKAAIIWCWQNGGYLDNNDLISKLDKIISNIGTTNFILIGLHTFNAIGGASQESALQSKYGDRFLNWRKYVSTNALYDFGIVPTADSDLTASQISNGVKSDMYQMSIGGLPSSLWRNVYGVAGDTSNDNTHMNAAGYMILGYKIAERLKIIGAV